MLFANAVSWLDSSIFRAESVAARGPGAVAVEAPNSAADQISVRTADGANIPWVLEDGVVRFYADEQDVYRVTTADHDLTLALKQPQVPAVSWEPPASVLRGVPAGQDRRGEPPAPWPWLAGLGALILLYDWTRFRRAPPLNAAPAQTAASDTPGGKS